MLLRDLSGRVIDAIPYHKNHLFVELLLSEGLSPYGIYVSEDDSHPQTEAVVCELPRDQTILRRYYPGGLERGDHIVSKRYAYTFFAWDYAWTEVEVVDREAVPYSPFPIFLDPDTPIKLDETFSRRGIYSVNIADVECLIKDPV